MFWQFGSRSETAAVAGTEAGAVVGVVVAAADVGVVVAALLPPHAVTAAAKNASSTIGRPCRKRPPERVIGSSLPQWPCSFHCLLDLSHTHRSSELRGPIRGEHQLEGLRGLGQARQRH